MNKIRVLTPAFFERFFDSDMAAGAASLKTSFFWLVAFLAVPGIAMPVLMSFNWALIGRFSGFDQLDHVVRADKVLYLGYGAWAVGLVTATAWNALLLDRRDGLVLGPLPVSGRDVIVSKMLAQAGYALLLMVTMHAGSSVFFGIFLGQLRGWGSIFGTTAAHFAASSLCGMFIFFSMVSIQGVALLTVGGRRFLRVSPLLQLLSVAVILAGFFMLPAMTNAVVSTIDGKGALNAPWIFRTPMLWYLGVYEVLLGHRDPRFIDLAWTGIIALVGVMLTAAVSFPLSYRRVMTTSVEQAGSRQSGGLMSALVRLSARLGARTPQTRAALEFFLLTTMRYGRQRLTVAIALGASIAWTVPAATLAFSGGVPVAPAAPLLGIPLALMMFLVAGIRVAASLPSELPPRWMFAAVSVSSAAARSAVSRVAFAFAVIAPSLAAAALIGSLWSWRLAAIHVVVCISVGILLIELAFARFFGMPCTRTWNPDDANLRAFWPVYLGGFLLFSYALPRLELMWQHDWVALPWCVGLPLAGAVATRIITRRVPPDPEPPLDEQPGVQVLDI